MTSYTLKIETHVATGHILSAVADEPIPFAAIMQLERMVRPMPTPGGGIVDKIATILHSRTLSHEEYRAALGQLRMHVDEPPVIHVPGVWRCAKCQFQLIQSNLNAVDGTVTARDEAGDKCPNDGAPLWRVTWKAYATEQLERAEHMFNENRAEIARLREAVVIYGDRVRMATSSRPDLQQSIDDAFEAIGPRPQPVDPRDATIAALRGRLTGMIPANLNVRNANVPGSTVVPIDFTMAELRDALDAAEGLI